MSDIIPCTECGADRTECGHSQECEDCRRTVFLDDGHEWPETGTIRCWACQHKLIERMETALDEISSHSVCCDARHIADKVWEKTE